MGGAHVSYPWTLSEFDISIPVAVSKQRNHKRATAGTGHGAKNLNFHNGRKLISMYFLRAILFCF